MPCIDYGHAMFTQDMICCVTLPMICLSWLHSSLLLQPPRTLELAEAIVQCSREAMESEKTVWMTKERFVMLLIRKLGLSKQQACMHADSECSREGVEHRLVRAPEGSERQQSTLVCFLDLEFLINVSDCTVVASEQD